MRPATIKEGFGEKEEFQQECSPVSHGFRSRFQQSIGLRSHRAAFLFTCVKTLPSSAFPPSNSGPSLSPLLIADCEVAPIVVERHHSVLHIELDVAVRASVGFPTARQPVTDVLFDGSSDKCVLCQVDRVNA